MNAFLKKIFFLIMVPFFVELHPVFAGFPPVEVVTNLNNYRLISVTPSLEFKFNNADLRNKIIEVYAGLYEDQSTINSLDLDEIKNDYKNIVHCEKDDYGIIRFKFNYRRFIELFKFDKGLLRQKFRSGFLPFIVEYKFSCTLRSIQHPIEEVKHELVFNKFWGGEIEMEPSSDIFKHIQDARNFGQIVLTDHI